MAHSATETERDGEMRSEKVQPEKSKAEALTPDPDKAPRVLSPAESKAIYCIKQVARAYLAVGRRQGLAERDLQAILERHVQHVFEEEADKQADDGTAKALIERAARAVEGTAHNTKESSWLVIDAIEKFAAKIGKPPASYTAEEAEAMAKATIKNRVPEIAADIDGVHLLDAFLAASRRGRPRAKRTQDLKWKTYAVLIAALGLGEPKPRTLQVGFTRWKRAGKRLST